MINSVVGDITYLEHKYEIIIIKIRNKKSQSDDS